VPINQTRDVTAGSQAGTAAAAVIRAAGGAVLFSLPLLLTMEMWWLGFAMHRAHLVVFLTAFFPLLVALSFISGFEETFDIQNDVVDALVAFAVAAVIALIMLSVFGAIGPAMPAGEIVGKVMIQTVPASIGALLAQSQLSEHEEARPERANKYLFEIITMAAGAVFLAFHVAPTEEIQLVAHRTTAIHSIGLIFLSLLCMDGFAYAAQIARRDQVSENMPRLLGLLRYTVVGYAVAFLLSAFVLWSFGRFEDIWWGDVLRQTTVLAFPASIGATAARLIL
jgi:putative integral membrane protein (TIGR02587 family)